MLTQVVYVDIAIGFEPVFVGFDHERPDQGKATGGVGEDPHDVGSA